MFFFVLYFTRSNVLYSCHALICFTYPECLHPLQVSLIFPSVFIPVFPVSLCQFVLYVQVSQQVFSRDPAFLLHFKDDGTKKIQKNGCFFSLYHLLPDLLCYILLHSHFHKLQSVSFQMVPRICISLLQGLSYRQLDLGMSFRWKLKKGGYKKKLILVRFRYVHTSYP